jgi:glucosylceramidase
MKATDVLSLQAFSFGAILLFGLFSHTVRRGDSASQVHDSGSNRIDVVESSEDLRESLQDKPPLHFGSSRDAGLTIEVDDSVKYQQIDGFGASLTDSSSWLISQKLSKSQRAQLLEMLFDLKKGIGLSMLRQPMGVSDFALKDYTYDDMPQG